MLARPFVVLDELDKAARDQRRAALAVLANGFCFEREGELHRQHAVPLLTANKDRALPEYAARRAIVLDLDPACARGELAAIARFAGELEEISRAGMFPTIDLDALLPPPSPAIAEADHRLLLELLPRSMTDERRRSRTR
jgi:hypothetical protein